MESVVLADSATQIKARLDEHWKDVMFDIPLSEDLHVYLQPINYHELNENGIFRPSGLLNPGHHKGGVRQTIFSSS